MYEKPTQVTGGVPEEFLAGKKTEIIPGGMKERWVQLDYDDIAFGVNIWDTVDSDMNALERKLKRNKKETSLTVGALQAEELYHKALLRKMKIIMNGDALSETWYDIETNETGFRFLQKWIKHKIDNEEFPKPDWLKKLIQEEEDAEEEEKVPITPSEPGQETQVSFGAGGEEAGIECIEPLEKNTPPI